MVDCGSENVLYPHKRVLTGNLPAAANTLHQATIPVAERTERTPGIDVVRGVCRALAVTPDQLFRRAGLLPAERDAEQQDEGFRELWGVYKRLTLRQAQDGAAGERAAVIYYALFQEGRWGSCPVIFLDGIPFGQEGVRGQPGGPCRGGRGCGGGRLKVPTRAVFKRIEMEVVH